MTFRPPRHYACFTSFPCQVHNLLEITLTKSIYKKKEKDGVEGEVKLQRGLKIHSLSQPCR